MSYEQVGIVDRYGNLMAASDTSYDAASQTVKELADWKVGRASADVDLLDELDTIVSRSQDLSRNNSVVSGYEQTLVDNVVGPELKLAAMPNYIVLGKDKEWAGEFARDVEARWRAYSKTTEFDVTRQQTFGSMTQTVFRSCMAGDATVIPYWLKGRKYRTCFMHIDSARLDNPENRMNEANLRKGIKTNRIGEVVSYFVRRSHPFDVDMTSMVDDFEEIQAYSRRGRKQFIHVFDKKRPGQSRGEPLLASVMADLKMTGKYQSNELETAIANSLISAFIQSSMDFEGIADAFNADYKTYLGERKTWKARLKGGSVIQLPPGDSVTPFTPSRPAAAFGAFMEYAYRNIATGLNVPYEILMKDFSKVNYSSARAAMLEAFRFFNGRRTWLSTYWAQPCYELWFEECVLRGEIEAPDFYANKAAYTQAKWIGPGRGWVDIVKEAKGSQIKMDIGLSTQQDECAEQGKDWEEVQDQRAYELKRGLETAERIGLPQSMAPVIAGFSTDSAKEPVENYFIPEDEDKPNDKQKPDENKQTPSSPDDEEQ